LKKIIVSVTNDLTTDQRVHKVCTSLVQNGYEVSLIGRKLKESLPIKRNYHTFRMKLLFNKGFLFYAEYNFRLFVKLFFIKKDTLVANDLDSLLPNYLIHKIFKSKLVYDSHELFTEVPELIHRPFVQKFWVKIEKKIVPKLNNCITVCQSISDFYQKKYNVKFHVIRNVPIHSNNSKSLLPFDTQNKKIILYQGALNLGRGLDLMIQTMQLLDNCIFVIVGSGDIDSELKQQVMDLKISSRVKFLGRVIPEKLKQLTPLADLGISFEEDLGLNYRFALPNKIFDYIQADVPCLVSDLPEMKNIILPNDFGEILIKRNPKEVALQIEKIFKKNSTYTNWKNNIKLNKDKFTWQVESKKLMKIYNNLK
jgi:glycosyltransferase involved in cell wall biosynthesis